MKRFNYNMSCVWTILLMSLIVLSCGKQKPNLEQYDTTIETESVETEEAVEEQKQFQERSVAVKVYSGEAITGDDASYFEIVMPEGDEINLELKEGKYHPEFRFTIPLQIVKKYPGKISYFSMDLELLDDSKDRVTSLSLVTADKESLETQLQKGSKNAIEVTFKGSAYQQEDMDKVKYYRIKGVSISGDADQASSATTSSSDSSSSSSKASKKSSKKSSKYDDSDDDDSDYSYDDDSGSKSKWKKVKEKTKEYKEKVKEKWNEWWD